MDECEIPKRVGYFLSFGSIFFGGGMVCLFWVSVADCTCPYKCASVINISWPVRHNGGHILAECGITLEHNSVTLNL